MGIDQETIKTIVQRVREAVDPERIILFGSAATGQMTQDSDIDLLILKKGVSEPRQERRKARMALRNLQYPVDVLFMDPQYFEETKDIIGGLAFPANKYGMVIYE